MTTKAMCCFCIDRKPRKYHESPQITTNTCQWESIVTLTQNKENALERFETIPQSTHGLRCDELVHDDLSQILQETFAHDLKERKQLKQIRTIDRQPIRKVKYEHSNQKSSTQPSVTHIRSWTKLFTSIGD